MKTIKFFTLMLCIAAMGLATACSKDDNKDSGNSGNTGTIKDVATFNDLNTFIGRTDLDALKTELRDAGYALGGNAKDKYIEAEKRTLTTSTSYRFTVEDGMVIGAEFMYGEDGLRTSGKLKTVVLEKINEEKTFSAGKTLKRYKGFVYNGEGDQHSFTSREEFVSWFTNATLSSQIEGESECEYQTYGTSVDIYPDDWAISVELK